tara:strand:+ start:46 stop:213 length:168 start_codon:yes stop_codon:yes gene_type:complete
VGHACVVRPEGHDARARQRRDIHDGVDLAQPLGIHEGVGEREATLRIRVEDLVDR